MLSGRSCGRSVVCFATALVGVLIPASASRAEPVLEVRSTTRIAVHVSRGETGLEAQVALTDDVGEPVADAAVLVFAAGCTESTCRTRADGTCLARLPACAARGVRARFEDDGRNESAEAESRVDGADAPPRLELVLEGGAEIDLDEPLLHVRASVGDEAPRGLRFRDELGVELPAREVAPGRYALSVASLGPVGVGRLLAEVSLEGGRVLRAERMVVRTRALTVTLEQVDDGLVAVLRDTAGPVAGEVLVLERDGAEAGSGVTDAGGRVLFALASGDHVQRALHPPQRPGRAFAASTPVQTSVRGLGHTLTIVFGLSLLATFVVAWRRRRTEVARPGAMASASPTPPPTVALAARTAWIAHRDDVALRVIAREDGAPLACTVQVDAEAPQPLEAGARLERTLPRGVHTIEVRADGRMAERVTVTVPHRGEHGAMVVRLETPRTFARRAVDHAAASAADERAPADLLTLRDAAAKLPALPSELVEETERAVYAEPDPSAEQARAVVEATRQVAGQSTPPTRRAPNA